MIHGSLTSIMLGVSVLTFLSSIFEVKPGSKMLSSSHTTHNLQFPRDACLCLFLSLPANPVRCLFETLIERCTIPMASFLAIGAGLLAWPLVSYLYPNVFSQIPFQTGTLSPHVHLNRGSVITPQLSAFIENTLALENITGLSVAVISKDGEPEFRAWGYRTEDGDEVTPDVCCSSSLWQRFNALSVAQTLFHMGSVSKAFCATALGPLIDDFANGRNVTALPSGLTELTWHTRLRDLFPEWQLMDSWASERANLRDILSHVSGIPR